MGSKLTDHQLKEILPNHFTAARNHYQSDCPICGKKEKFYINRNNQLWDCKKCHERGNIFQLLAKIGKLSLLNENGKVLTYNNPDIIDNPIREYQEENNITDEKLLPVPIKLPIGYKKIDNDEYLNSRGFKPLDYKYYEIGVTKLKTSLKGYIIIPVRENDIICGYLARSKKSKEQIDSINKNYEEQGIHKKHLRWQNSTSADFSKLIGGIDEITEGVDTVILVEGFFAKKKVDEVFKLRKSKKVKCCFTFGKHFSKWQVAKIVKKGISNIIILFDPDAVSEIKEISFDIDSYFNSILIGVINDDQDIDDMSKEDLFDLFDKLVEPFEYFNNRV